MTSRRLLTRVPHIYVGPDAQRALAGEKGILLGARRAQWIDVARFEPRHELGWAALLELRFAAFAPWDAVGLSLSAGAFAELGERLLRELVPGDVLLTERGPSVHRGDAWTKAKFV